MTRRVGLGLGLCLAVPLWLLACSDGGDDSNGAGGPMEGATPGASDTPGTPGTSDTTGTPDTPGAAGAAGAAGASGDPGAASDASCGAAAAGGDSSDGAGGVELSCTGASDSCTECIGEKCCDLLHLCDDDADCACMAVCAGERGLGQLDTCLTECDLSGSPPGFAALAECTATACPDSDECSTPAGFAPPAPIASGETGGASSGSGSIGSGSMADCGFDPALPFNAEGEVLQLQSADGQVCVRVERRNDGAGSLANTNWTLLNLTLGPVDEVVQIDDALCWYSSHHNFADWAHAWSGSRHYDLELTEDGHGGPRTYTLYSFEQGELDPGACAPLADGVCAIGDPIVLTPVMP